MADRLKMKQPAYSDIESGKRKVSLEKIEEIASIFKIKIEDLTFIDEKQIFHNTFN